MLMPPPLKRSGEKTRDKVSFSAPGHDRLRDLAGMGGGERHAAMAGDEEGAGSARRFLVDRQTVR